MVGIKDHSTKKLTVGSAKAVVEGVKVFQMFTLLVPGRMSGTPRPP